MLVPAANARVELDQFWLYFVGVFVCHYSKMKKAEPVPIFLFFFHT